MRIKLLCLWALGSFMACSPGSKVSQDTTTQEKSPYLLTVGNENVPAEEFLYILSKNRDFEAEEDKISPEELEENLSLFINYKLKVKEAEALGMHESEEFRREFSTFKEDLKKPYLLENSLLEGELRKAYDRTREMVHASHILLRFPANAKKEDSIAVFRMAQNLKEKALEGADFNELAKEYSQDPSVQNNEGDLGYFTALQMVYPFEDAAYSLQPGEVSDPIPTEYGYHIIKLWDRKPNPGQIKVSHILIRTDPSDPLSEDRAKRKIGDIYLELQKEDNTWKEICSTYSEDQGTRESAGKLPWFGIGSFIPEFEEAAFALEEQGEISNPIKSPYGYHIIRLEDTKPLASYEEMEESMKSKILRDSRSKLIQEQVRAIQKSKYRFAENMPLIQSIQPVFDKYQRKGLDSLKLEMQNRGLMDSAIFSVREVPKTVEQFIAFIEADMEVVKVSSRKFFAPWLKKYEEVSLNEAEEEDLLASNEEYRLSVKEYRDGILLFNLMNDQVWQKAMQDSSGQLSYYKEHLDRYQWEERIEALIASINKKPLKDSLMAFLKSQKYHSNLKRELEETFSTKDPLAFNFEQGIFELDKHPVLKKADPKKKLQELTYKNKDHFVLMGNRLPATSKKFEETRGKVIQDYQEALDKKLISKLKENYIIRINEEEKERISKMVVKN